MSLWTSTDNDAGKPKYLSDTLRNDQTETDKAATAGISASEAAVAANKAKGVQHGGWVKTMTYTDAQGNTRNKTETLVAMGSMSSDNNADDTTIGADS